MLDTTHVRHLVTLLSCHHLELTICSEVTTKACITMLHTHERSPLTQAMVHAILKSVPVLSNPDVPTFEGSVRIVRIASKECRTHVCGWPRLRFPGVRSTARAYSLPPRVCIHDIALRLCISSHHLEPTILMRMICTSSIIIAVHTTPLWCHFQ